MRIYNVKIFFTQCFFSKMYNCMKFSMSSKIWYYNFSIFSLALINCCIRFIPLLFLPIVAFVKEMNANCIRKFNYLSGASFAHQCEQAKINPWRYPYINVHICHASCTRVFLPRGLQLTISCNYDCIGKQREHMRRINYRM